MKIQNFGLCHSQELIDKSALNKIPDFKWLCVGDYKYNNNPNQIILRDLEFNIECKKRFLHYTGYWALLKNNLIDEDTDYIRFIEWDLQPNNIDDYVKATEDRLKSGLPIYGHLKVRMSHYFDKPVHLNNINRRALKEVYKFDMCTIASTVVQLHHLVLNLAV
jgi:hypothetical protein